MSDVVAARITLTVDVLIEHNSGTSDPTIGYEPPYDYLALQIVKSAVELDDYWEGETRYLADCTGPEELDPDGLLSAEMIKLLRSRTAAYASDTADIIDDGNDVE